MSETARALEQLVAPLRRRAAFTWAAAGAGAAALALGTVAWLARAGAFGVPWWVFLGYALALVGAGLAAWRGRRQADALRTPVVAPVIEAAGGFRLGAVTTLLAPLQGGASEALHRLADTRLAGELAGRREAALAPLLGALGRDGRRAGVVAAVGLAALVSAAAGSPTGALVLRPARAWELLVAPVSIAASAAAVDRGAPVTLTVRAAGARSATLWLRGRGETWRPRTVALDSAGTADVVTAPLDGDLFAHVTAAGRGSDTVSVRVRLPVFLGALTVTAAYPAYLGLDPEPLPTGGDTLVLPAGTRLVTKGSATAPLAGAAWGGPAGEVPLAVDGDRFAGAFQPAGSGTWRLRVTTADGAPLAGDAIALPIRVLPDQPPAVTIPVPGADTVAAPDITVPVVVDVQDDHGLRVVTLEVRRTSRLGFADPPTRELLPLPRGRVDRAILNATIDLRARGAGPGDTLRYVAIATDNAPGGQVTRSREFVLRIATLSEARAEERREAREARRAIDSLLKATKQLERQTEDLARERPRAGQEPQGGSEQQMGFQEAKKAEAVAEGQRQLMEQAEQLQRELDELQKAAEGAGQADSAFRARLDEVREQLRRAMTPEMQQRLQALEQALKDLDADRAREALKDLAERQKELREALERSRELFRRAALEGDLQNLASEARDLEAEQQRWAEQAATADSARAAAQEQQLAERADSLASALDEAGKALKPEGRQEAMQQLAQKARKASQKMKQAKQSMQRGQRQQAQQQGEEAEEQLDQVDEELEEEREQLQEEWREEVTAALDQALAETSRLTERQLGVEQAMRQGRVGAQTRAESGAIEEGVARLVELVQKTQGKNALVPPAAATALQTARLQLQRSRDAIASAQPNPREATDRAGEAIDALNLAAFHLLRARGNVGGSGSGSGLAEAMQQMQQMASQQGQMASSAAGMLPQAGTGQMSEGVRALGQEQRRMAEQLERMRAQGDIGGAGELAEEAKELARRLEAGRLDRETVERQERLFRRMLDAGRTLQGEQEDEKKERQGETAKPGELALPPALRRRLGDVPRLPSWEELQRLSPAERRVVLDYFRRLAQ
ncbi:MAG: hypothetical protein NW201_13020 [Gemmatimonadales bacterium]|nr:hypothetical protein [Gemmatimonadales bacterium]